MNTSPSDASEHHLHQHPHVSKYGGGSSESNQNGQADSLSDFVTFVCQDNGSNASSQGSGGGGGQNDVEMARSKSAASQYSQYSTMLPPPPLPPMARPVAIIRSTGDLTMVSSAQMTPPQSIASPHQDHQDSISGGGNDMNQSPPLSPQSQMDGRCKLRISSPYSLSREYSFNHFQTQTTQVRKTIQTAFSRQVHQNLHDDPLHNEKKKNSRLQLFSYPSSISTMPINPTNLSLYSTPVTTPRSSRWNPPFLLEEDLNMMTQHPISSNNPVSNSVILMEEGTYNFACTRT